MPDAPQQTAPRNDVPLGNKIAIAIMIGLGAVICAYELMHDNGRRLQQDAAAPSHHSLQSAATTGSGG